MMTIDWSNRILFDGTKSFLSKLQSLGMCSYCKKYDGYDTKNECVNCGAHRDDKPKTTVSNFTIKETK
jgi:hypothetical protein